MTTRQHSVPSLGTQGEGGAGCPGPFCCDGSLHGGSRVMSGLSWYVSAPAKGLRSEHTQELPLETHSKGRSRPTQRTAQEARQRGLRSLWLSHDRQCGPVAARPLDPGVPRQLWPCGSPAAGPAGPRAALHGPHRFLHLASDAQAVPCSGHSLQGAVSGAASETPLTQAEAPWKSPSYHCVC